MAPGGRQGILSLTIKDKNALYAAYMQFVKNGGLFIPTNKKYKIGDEVFMLLTLMDETERIPVAGKIIWVTPIGAEGNKAAGVGVGVGVQFSEQDGGMTRNKIEGYLAEALKSERPTHTM
ncbi:MAG: PilZ domain-containing protein [Candidatus Sedimenticola endophacoides]